MKLTLFLATIGCSLLFIMCASTIGNFQNRLRVSQVKSWQIVYLPRLLTTSRQFTGWETSDQVEPVTQTRSELQFPRSVLSILKNKFKIPLTDDTSEVHTLIACSLG
jgi:hypothetical protein